MKPSDDLKQICGEEWSRIWDHEISPFTARMMKVLQNEMEDRVYNRDIEEGTPAARIMGYLHKHGDVRQGKLRTEMYRIMSRDEYSEWFQYLIKMELVSREGTKGEHLVSIA